VFFLEDKVSGGDWRVVQVQKEPCVRHVVAMVEDMTFGANIDGRGIMAFANLQANAENHDLSNINEKEKVVATEVEHVEALIKEGGLSSDSDDVTLVSDPSS